jgi:hemerythrin-like domain-containing protein
MNAFELLKADHTKVNEIFEQLEPTTERGVKTREELFNKLKQELTIHAQIEEKVFYPVLEEAGPTHEIVLEAYEEHNLVKQLLEELDAMPKDSEEWKAKLTVLQENVEHHVEEEEGEMFPKAKRVLTAEQIQQLGDELQAAKQQQKKMAAGAS